MKRILGLLIAASLFIPQIAHAQEGIKPPDKIVLNHKTFLRNTAWRDKEFSVSANLDADADDEIITGFMGTYTPPVRTEEKTQGLFSNTAPPPIPIQENQAFYRIYDKDAGGHYRCVKTLTGMDQIGSVHILALDPEKPNAFLIIGPGGDNYSEISVYRWQTGGYRMLFSEGGTGEAEFIAGRQPCQFRLGSRTYVWNRARQTFEQSQA